MNKIEEYINMARLNELVGKKEAEKKMNPVVMALAIIGVIVTVGAIAYAVYKFLIPDYFEDYEDFEDDFDDFEEDFEEEMKAVEEV